MSKERIAVKKKKKVRKTIHHTRTLVPPLSLHLLFGPLSSVFFIITINYLFIEISLLPSWSLVEIFLHIERSSGSGERIKHKRRVASGDEAAIRRAQGSPLRTEAEC
ncbi:hypothetical protein, unlikely [Trypanosoma brucei gambiense DAL972]|uniref:Uncharacterized protein n=1 Tax=Trypanosoma brucei gambiense (strain MHOM/CI/86/DAL972) TaxID=679716 RepID=D0AAP3_TRYB9|nr:hypothetical protein, unlikely [Trypanosoma brucei gambiense DAL972]CBH18744.1 hypothetical protein, unlikely [Trypanosoma brucei gambiense DAL972]|eukprot:XP_011781008.1 hypothetical protein, unlikely [Trypanosoma brucei gambiense DAL972]